jgi:hypothetical protein
MPVSLAQARLNTQDDLDGMVIDEFRKSSALLDSLIFHDAVNPMGGGSTLTYGYHRLVTQVAAAFRAINSEYVPSEVTKQRFTVDLKPLGGSFQIDRVLAQIARGAEVSLQMQQKIKATSTKFCDEVVNGDVAVDANGFDGLKKALAGSDTELGVDKVTDWSDIDASGYQKALDRVDEFLSMLNGQASVVMGNRHIIAKLAAIARRANQYIERPVAGLTGPLGEPIVRRFWGENIQLIDMGEKAGSTDLIIPLYDPDNSAYTVTVTGGANAGTFSLLVSVDGNPAEETAPIAFNAAGATVDAAIEALPDVPAGGVTVTGAGPYTVVFDGALAGHDVTVALADNNLAGGTTPSVTVAETGDTGGYTDLYAARIGMDGFHGVSVAGQPLVNTWLPDFERAGAVKTGEVEMGPVACALKATKAAAVLRRVKLR